MKPKHIIWLLAALTGFWWVRGEDPMIPICVILLIEYFEMRRDEQIQWTRRRMRQLWAELLIIQHQGLEDWLHDFDEWNKQQMKGNR